MRGVITSLCLCAAVGMAAAEDLGVQGTVFEIAEPDIRAVILGQLASQDMAGVGEDMAEGTRKFTSELTNQALPPPDQTRTRHVDLSMVLKEDFYLPVSNDDGTMSWRLMAHKGDRLNPLTQVRPATAFLIVDGTVPEQLELLLETWRAAPNYIVPLLSAGDVGELAKEFDAPVYRASPFIVERFDVRHVPALVRPGYGSFSGQIAVTEFADPWSLELIRKHDPLRAMSVHAASEYQHEID